MRKGYRRLWDTSQFDLFYLSNGIKVWIQKPVITISKQGYLSIFFDGIGSNRDFPCYSGVAHFLEHILFCGSHESKSRNELIKPVLKNGGAVNARTGFYFTEFFITANSRYFEGVVMVLSELVQELVFDENDLERERDVILEEFRSRRITGLDLVYKHLRGLVFPRGGNLLYGNIGYPKSISRVSSEILIDFYDKYYHSGNANIICGGNFSEAPKILDILEKFFGDMKKGEKNLMPKNKVDLKGGLFSLRDRRYTKDGIIISYFFPHQTFEDKKIIEFLFDYIDCSSSPLRQRLISERGLVYSLGIETIYSHHSDGVIFCCLTEPKNFQEILDIFFETLSEITENDLEDYFEAVNQSREGAFLSPVSVCADLAEEINTFGRPYSFHEAEAMADSLDFRLVLKARDEILRKKPSIIKFRKS